MFDPEPVYSEEEIEEIIENNEVQEEEQPVQESENTENQTDQANETDENKTEVKVKKVRNPQPKLNADRLKGPRGIQTLEGIFEKVKFKGRGHEEDDLKTLLKGYEYWCHRLYPKFRFDDCIEKIEQLGSKKIVQAHVRKIRLNMLFLDDTVNEENDNDNENTEALEPEIDPFNSLVSTQAQSLQTNLQSQEYELTEDQLQRIRANKERALKRRQELILQKQSQEEASGSGITQPLMSQVSDHDTQSSDDRSVGEPILISSQDFGDLNKDTEIPPTRASSEYSTQQFDVMSMGEPSQISSLQGFSQPFAMEESQPVQDISQQNSSGSKATEMPPSLASSNCISSFDNSSEGISEKDGDRSKGSENSPTQVGSQISHGLPEEQPDDECDSENMPTQVTSQITGDMSVSQVSSLQDFSQTDPVQNVSEDTSTVCPAQNTLTQTADENMDVD